MDSSHSDAAASPNEGSPHSEPPYTRPPYTRAPYTRHPFTDAARARLAMAYEACDLAEIARAAVPVGERELRPDGTTHSPGSVLSDAAHVLRAAQRFFEAATVYERLGGANWQVIGDVLGVDAPTARARFTAAESCFREELRAAESASATKSSTQVGWWRDYVAGNPLEAARDLDDWVLRHADGDAGGDGSVRGGGDAGGDGRGRGSEDGDGNLGATPVSGGLT
ncbi:hypothetical protein AB0I66_11455 [Streptomyces sp. NPDC050439]|uniref:hypothetical protein n=1 Tax=unclassified Streptomyces TaxID=2593676 RepID=UPI00342EB54B